MRIIRLWLWLVVALLAVGRSDAATGVLDELKLGVLDHDIAIGGHHVEPGVDANAELLFVSPGLLAPILAPRPHLGVTVNSDGKNSYAYAGLTWLAAFGNVFADLGLGGAVHDGPDSVSRFTTNHKGLGTRVLFHEELEIGYRFSPAWSVAAFLDHISNANLGNHNPGLTNLGARMGYSF